MASRLLHLQVGVLTACSWTATSGCIIPIGTNGLPTGDAGPGPNNNVVPDAAIPPGSWSNATGTLANMPSQCGNMTSLWAKPDEDLLIAGIAGDGLWASSNGGTSWHQLDQGTGAVPIVTRPTQVLFDPDVTTRFWEAGIYGDLKGVFETTDDGVTFKDLPVQHNDSVSVDFSDPMRKTILAGGHEDVQSLWRSVDQGMTFTNVGKNLPSTDYCTFPLVLDPMNHLVGCGELGSQAIYRTSNGGTTWTNVSMEGGASEPLVTHDGTIYWGSPNGGAIVQSIDKGLTWTEVTPSGTAQPVHIIELPDEKRIATLGSNPLTVIASADQGKSWYPVSPKLPYSDARGVTYSKQEKAFFVWHFTCDNGPDPVPADAVMRWDFDYTKN